MKKKWMAAGALLAVAVGTTSYFATATTATTAAPVSTPRAQQIASIVPIQDKMLNAIDNYQDLQGTYHEVDTTIGLDATYDFSVQEGDNPGSDVNFKDHKTGNVIEHKADGHNIMHFDHGKNSYVKTKYDRSKDDKFNSNRIYKDENGAAHYTYRQDPAYANIASDVTFPQVYAFWMSTAPYQIIGHETLLGRDTTVIEGQFDTYLAQKQHAVTYKLWVDSATGVLLKKVEANQAGEPVVTLEVTSIQFNSGKVDHSKFNTYAPLNAKDETPADMKGK